MLSDSLTLDQLFALVTDAILRADTLADLGSASAQAAYLDVSGIEEAITQRLPADHPDGALARRGAVRAAVAAGDDRRARELAERFKAEPDTSDELRREIQELSDGSDDVIAARWPCAARRYGVREIRRVTLARARQSAPFPIR